MDGADRITRRANVGIVDWPCHCSPTLNLGFPAIRVSGDWLMRRRNFLRVLGGAAAWPLAARAQQGGPVRRIGVLMNNEETDPISKAYLASFVQGLRKLGWIEGQTLGIEVRWNPGDAERARSLAGELLRLSPEVIL